MPQTQSASGKMKSALKAVRNGMSLRQASITFGVAKSTIHAHLNKRKVDEVRLERSGKLSPQDEQRLANWLVYCHHMGFVPITHIRLREEATNLSKFLGSEQKFNKEWGKYFTQSQPKIRATLSLYKNCRYFDKQSLEIWFKSLSDFCKEHKLQCLDKPQQMFYCSKLHLTENFKLILSYSASGMATPPLLIAANLKDSEGHFDSFDNLNLPRGWVKYNCQKVPYHQDQENIFHYYIEHVLKSYLLQRGMYEPFLLFVKSDSYPPKLPLYELCEKLKIFLVNSYPTAFKLDQMLQNEISMSVKTITDKTPYSLVDLVKKVLMTKLTKVNMAKSFQESGIHPLDITQIKVDLLPTLQPKLLESEDSDDEAPESCDIEHIDTGEISPPTPVKHKPRISLDWEEFRQMLGCEMIDKLEDDLDIAAENNRSQEFQILMRIYRKFSLDQSEEGEDLARNDDPADDDPLSGINSAMNVERDVHVDLWE